MLISNFIQKIRRLTSNGIITRKLTQGVFMQYNQFIGLGVAGNFVGHLEQAGEALDFANVKTQEIIQLQKQFFHFMYLQSN